ncbi:hypothetical protein N9W41_00115 [bacterium]|nr:hypothetical protein [bacterium]
MKINIIVFLCILISINSHALVKSFYPHKQWQRVEDNADGGLWKYKDNKIIYLNNIHKKPILVDSSNVKQFLEQRKKDLKKINITKYSVSKSRVIEKKGLKILYLEGSYVFSKKSFFFKEYSYYIGNEYNQVTLSTTNPKNKNFKWFKEKNHIYIK